jgi:hypothetical protein
MRALEHLAEEDRVGIDVCAVMARQIEPSHNKRRS